MALIEELLVYKVSYDLVLGIQAGSFVETKKMVLMK